MTTIKHLPISDILNDLNLCRNLLCHRKEETRLFYADYIFLQASIDESLPLELFKYFITSTLDSTPSRSLQVGVLDVCRKVHKRIRTNRKTKAFTDPFAQSIIKTVLYRIEPTAPHARISLAVSLIETLIYLSPATLSDHLRDQLTKIFLITLVGSPFELSRIAAYELLRKFGSHSLLCSLENDLKETAWTLSSDVKTLARLRGAMVWRFVAWLGGVNGRPAEALHELLDVLETNIKTSQNDYSSTFPLVHGIMEAIAYLINDFPAYILPPITIKKLGGLILSTIQLSLHFFSETQFLELGDLDEEDWEGDNGSMRGTLIACAWRSVKAAAVALVRMFENLVEQNANTAEVKDLAARTGAAFVQVLTEVRHWGAANSVQGSLTQLCTIFAQSADEDLRTLPEAWLQGIMSSLSTSDIIRHDDRHAGPARTILAILNGAFPKIQPKKAALRPVLDQLFHILHSTTIDDGAKVNALSILHWILKDARTGQILPFEEVSILVFSGLNSDTLSIRNANTVLFSCILSRFLTGNAEHSKKLGVPKDIDAFFNAYPRLFLAVTTELERCGNVTYPPPGTQYPLLLLLSGLEKSAEVESEADSPTAIIVPLLYKIAVSSPVEKVRILAARCVTSLTREANRVPLCRQFVAKEYHGYNAMHGNLLTAQFLIEALKENERHEELGHLVSILTRPAIYQASMPLVQSAVLNVLQLCTPLLSRSDNFSTVVGWIDRIVIDEPSQHGMVGYPILVASATKLSLSLCSTSQLASRCQDSLNRPDSDIVTAVLEWLAVEDWAEKVEHSAVVQMMVNKLEQLSSNSRTLRHQVEIIIKILTKCTTMTSCDARRLVQLSETLIHTELSDSMVRCDAVELMGHAVRFLHGQRDLESFFQSWMDVLKACIESEKDALHLHEAAAKSISRLGSLPSVSDAVLSQLWTIIISLLQDADENVSGPAADFASNVLCPTIPAHASRCIELTVEHAAIRHIELAPNRLDMESQIMISALLALYHVRAVHEKTNVCGAAINGYSRHEVDKICTAVGMELTGCDLTLVISKRLEPCSFRRVCNLLFVLLAIIYSDEDVQEDHLMPIIGLVQEMSAYANLHPLIELIVFGRDGLAEGLRRTGYELRCRAVVDSLGWWGDYYSHFIDK